MRKLVLCIALACTLFSGVSSAKVIREFRAPASDSRITYVGRVLKDGGNVSFDWTGVSVRISFGGSYLAMTASDTKADYYDIWIDKEPCAKADRTIRVSGADSTYILADPDIIMGLGLDGKSLSHKVTLKKRTEGEQGRTTISEFITKGLELTTSEGLKKRQFEVIGDSYTCGYGTENCTKEDPFTPETENSNLTYAAILARYFNADYYAVAHSGMGIARNYDDNVKGYYMPDRYLQTFDQDKDVKWDASADSFRPALTIIYLCTNDFSTRRQPSLSAFKENYIRLLRQVKDNYGEGHKILCISSKCDDMAADYVRDAVNSCGMTDVHFLSITDAIHNNDDELGASWHPNYKGHIKLSHTIIPYVSTLTGWEINDDIK